MNRNYLRHAASVFVLLMAIVACVLPGQATQPAPLMDPITIETAVAGTAQAAEQQTATAQLFTETPVGMSGTNIEQLSDGTTKYTDYDARFEVTFPTGWLALRPNSEEFNAALVNQGATNSMLHEQMTADQAGYEAKYDRLYSYILRPDIKTNVMFGFSKMAWDPDDPKVLDNANMGELVQGLESQALIPGFRVDVAQIHDEGNTRVIEIGGRWKLNDGTSDPVPFYSILYFFKPTQTSTVRISISFVQDYQAEFAAGVKSIMDSIKVIGP